MPYTQHISSIYLYDEPDAAGLDIEDIGGYLASQLPVVELVPRSDFFTHQFARFTEEQRSQLEPELMRQLAAAQVTATSRTQEGEGNGREEETDSELGLVFEAPAYQTILRLLVDPEESAAEHLHIAFTANGIGSWREEEGFRLHIICMGAPSIISTTCLVEALPRPKEYQFKRAQLAMLGLGEGALEDLTEEFAHRTFGYGDPRINEVCKGYALMAVFYRAFGEAFCDDPTCRLRAAKSQEELIEAQCGENTGLCERHEGMLKGLEGK